jgi:hypothetical protein
MVLFIIALCIVLPGAAIVGFMVRMIGAFISTEIRCRTRTNHIPIAHIYDPAYEEWKMLERAANRVIRVVRKPDDLDDGGKVLIEQVLASGATQEEAIRFIKTSFRIPISRSREWVEWVDQNQSLPIEVMEG